MSVVFVQVKVMWNTKLVLHFYLHRSIHTQIVFWVLIMASFFQSHLRIVWRKEDLTWWHRHCSTSHPSSPTPSSLPGSLLLSCPPLQPPEKSQVQRRGRKESKHKVDDLQPGVALVRGVVGMYDQAGGGKLDGGGGVAQLFISSTFAWHCREIIYWKSLGLMRHAPFLICFLRLERAALRDLLSFSQLQQSQILITFSLYYCSFWCSSKQILLFLKMCCPALNDKYGFVIRFAQLYSQMFL